MLPSPGRLVECWRDPCFTLRASRFALRRQSESRPSVNLKNPPADHRKNEDQQDDGEAFAFLAR